ncbi:MAG: DUF59 domain-containing protein [Anaerolineaceae bacterium]|nr:DUF59 domain-containing protein [Anaerolineaceae bacterium]
MSETSKVTWTFDQENPTLSEALREGLNLVMDPELGLSVVQLGLIRDVKTTEDGIQVDMILTTPFCPYAPVLVEQVTVMSENVLRQPVMVELGDEAWDPEMMEEGLDDWGLF